KDKDGKAFPSYLQYVKSANGREKIRRDWLIHSDSANALFCIPCLLFSHEQTRPSKSALNSKDGLKLADIKWQEHLEKVRQKKKGSRLTHYLSPDTQNEFIEICGKRVLNTILKEREDAIYYSVICDSTPDISHTEQNVLLIRYVHQDKEDSGVWKIVERFIEFKDFHKKTGQEISEMILEVCIENRNVILQAGDISLDVQAANIKALQEEMQALRDRWDSLLAEASLVAQTMDVPDHFRTEERRKRKRKRMPELLNAIWKMQLQSIFGELCIVLRIFCTLPVTVAGGERAFSKLKLVKNYLRSTMGQDRLNSLAILSIESQLAKQLDFTDLITDFANKKTRQWGFTGM
ncbi:hypothetical protein PO909_016205, partial [Leuciscus waleckii]